MLNEPFCVHWLSMFIYQEVQNCYNYEDLCFKDCGVSRLWILAFCVLSLHPPLLLLHPSLNRPYVNFGYIFTYASWKFDPSLIVWEWRSHKSNGIPRAPNIAPQLQASLKCKQFELLVSDIFASSQLKYAARLNFKEY